MKYIRDDTKDGEDIDDNKKQKMPSHEKIEELDLMDEIKAEGRWIFNPLTNTLDHVNKRCRW